MLTPNEIISKVRKCDTAQDTWVMLVDEDGEDVLRESLLGVFFFPYVFPRYLGPENGRLSQVDL